MTDWKDKIVWVTGASSGIGAEIAKQAAHAGATVILSARKEAELQAIRLLLPNSDTHLVLPLDLADSSNFSSLVEIVKDPGVNFGPIVNWHQAFLRSRLHSHSIREADGIAYTYGLASSNPAGQRVPSDSKRDPRARKCWPAHKMDLFLQIVGEFLVFSRNLLTRLEPMAS